MKLILNLEYRTRWGEQLVLCTGQRRVAMKYVGTDRWQASLAKCELPMEYRYEVVAEGRTVRSEWRAHSLRLAEGMNPAELRVADRWIDMPADSTFYSSAFTQGIFGRGGEKRVRCAGANIMLQLPMPTLRPDEVLCLAASGREMGGWRRLIPFDHTDFPILRLPLKVSRPFEYKLVVADRRTLEPLCWEEGANREWTTMPKGSDILVESSVVPRFPERRWRGAGTAIPVFSLRSEEGFGVGEFLDLKKMVDWAVETGQRILQLLPVNDTTMTGTWEDSYPYNANSTFALHPQFVNLPAAGYGEDEEYRALREELNALPEVDYERVNNLKREMLKRLFDRKGAATARSRGYKEFMAASESWLLPYAAFCTLRDEFSTPDFSKWGEYAKYDKKRVDAYCKAHRDEVAFHCFVQFHLHLQLSEVCRYAHSRGIVLKGDLPIGISRTSADAWLSPKLFHMNSQAGAPPDAFSAEGQNWGFPTYNWERMEQDGYAWWRSRFGSMAQYFDVFRIDHILGFFRIWEIPYDAVHGLLGYFNPAMPYSAEELRFAGFDTDGGRYTTPPTDDWVLDELFGDLAGEVRAKYLKDGRLVASVATQRKVAEKFKGSDEKSVRLRNGLMGLLDDVLFIEDPRRKGYYHPRIGAQSTFAYRLLDGWHRDAFNRLHDDFFFRRHNDFWRETAMRKLPKLLAATGMLACGEDLGMIPDCVPDVMHGLQILSLEIQRMPKSVHDTFADPARYPYLSVCTTSTHDMNPLRAWWEEDRATTERFYREVLHGEGGTPYFCEPWVARRIVDMHLASPAMFTILPWQDWMAIDGELRFTYPDRERINVPAIPRYYWRYRMHMSIEELLRKEDFNAQLRDMIALSGRR